MNKKHQYLISGIYKITILVISFIALWMGAMVYIHLRSSNPVFIRWIEATGTEGLFSLNHLFFIKLPDWLVYSLPSGLWAFSYSILIAGIWWKNKSWIKYVWLASILLLVIGWEILQLKGIVKGTYSFGDILIGMIGAIIGIYIGIKFIKSKNHEKGTI